MMSLMVSRPTERRTISGLTPAPSWAVGFIWECVVVAGWIAKVRASPTLASMVAFVAVFYSGQGSLDYATMFAALSVFQALRVSMIMLPQTYMYILVMKVSFDRLDRYLFPIGELREAAPRRPVRRRLLETEGLMLQTLPSQV